MRQNSQRARRLRAMRRKKTLPKATRALFSEQLESRILLAADIALWLNSDIASDVNADGDYSTSETNVDPSAPTASFSTNQKTTHTTGASTGSNSGSPTVSFSTGSSRQESSQQNFKSAFEALKTSGYQVELGVNDSSEESTLTSEEQSEGDSFVTGPWNDLALTQTDLSATESYDMTAVSDEEYESFVEAVDTVFGENYLLETILNPKC